jgi:16S rRNA (cytidine1402-2'-O)-methyltransferase
VVACEDTRATGVLLDRYGVQATLVPTTSTTSASGRPSWSADARRRGRRAGLDAGMPLVSRSRLRARAGLRRRGARGRGAAGPSAALAALVASALPSDAWRFAGFLPAQARGAGRGFGSPETSWPSSRPRAWRRSLRSLASSTRRGRSRVCRELTKLHEEVVRGTRPTLAARYAAAADRGRGRARRRRGAPAAEGVDTAVDAVRRLVAAGAKPRVAAGVVADLTGAPANALYAAAAIG